jgi:hypothetical protein
MAEDIHHFHHDDPRVTVDLKVAHTTRGDTWEVEVKGAATASDAVAFFLDIKHKLEPHNTETKEATK